MTNAFVVICLLGRDELGDDAAIGEHGTRLSGLSEMVYTLATRRVFNTYPEAAEYARGIAAAREPVIASGRWYQLRVGGEA